MKNKGITLIALVITIIIMLILISVTVSYGIKSDLVSKAKLGATKTVEAQEKDLMGEKRMAYNTDKYIQDVSCFADYIENNLPLGAEFKEKIDDDTALIEFTNSKNQYYISEESFNKNQYKTTKNEDGKDEYVDEENKVKYTFGQKLTSQDLEKIGVKSGGTYTGTWTVIGTEKGKIKLISDKNIGGIQVGYKNEKAKAAIKVNNEGELTEDEKLDRSIWCTSNLLELIKEKVVDNTGIKEARCVNSEDIKKLLNNYKLVYEANSMIRYYWDKENNCIALKELKNGIEPTEENWLEKSTQYIDTDRNFYKSGNGIIDSMHTDKVITIKENYYEIQSKEDSQNLDIIFNGQKYILNEISIICKYNSQKFGITKYGINTVKDELKNSSITSQRGGGYSTDGEDMFSDYINIRAIVYI